MSKSKVKTAFKSHGKGMDKKDHVLLVRTGALTTSIEEKQLGIKKGQEHLVLCCSASLYKMMNTRERYLQTVVALVIGTSTFSFSATLTAPFSLRQIRTHEVRRLQQRTATVC